MEITYRAVLHHRIADEIFEEPIFSTANAEAVEKNFAVRCRISREQFRETALSADSSAFKFLVIVVSFSLKIW